VRKLTWASCAVSLIVRVGYATSGSIFPKALLMAPITYREAPPPTTLSDVQRAWLTRQGHDEHALTAWRRGELPAAQARRASPPGADPLLLVMGCALGVLLLLVVAAAVVGPRLWAAVVTFAAGMALLGGYMRRANPARRLGFGPVFERRATLQAVRGEETDDDVTRVTFAVRGVDAAGRPFSLFVSEWLYERVAAGSASEVYTLYAVERRGKPPVLCAILPEA